MNGQAVAPHTTGRLLAVLVWILAGHALRLPLWIDLFVAALLLWRAGVCLRGWPLLPKLLRIALTLAAIAGVLLSYGRINGQSAGLALLVVMLAAKLTELESRRDHRVLLFFAWFLLATHFLFSQELAMLPYAAVGALGLTMLMVDLAHPAGALPLRTLTALAGKALLLALPLMLVIFILFPRIPGPIWGLPEDAGAARSGLSDSMAPGDISALALSNAVAFRVDFTAAMPPPQQRYWRGPVFWHFDGRRWSAGQPAQALPVPHIQASGKHYRYTITLEPNRQHWLFALERPVHWPGPARLSPSGSLISDKPIKQRKRIILASAPAAQSGLTLPNKARQLALQLPASGNPKSRALARQWQQQDLHGRALVQAALDFLHSHDFLYTLQPPLLGRNSVDDFLFNTRRGFCEHYASAFTFLMRAAGLPARIVTGYQGGETSIDSNYLIVRQSNAHAWSEVWLAGSGWVRVDPTAAIVPARIENSLQSALIEQGLALSGSLRQDPIWHRLQLRMDWLDNAWNQFVLGYGPQLQAQFLARLGLTNSSRMILALTLLCAAFIGLASVLMLRGLWRLPTDPAQAAWLTLHRKLSKKGLPLTPHTGPQDLLHLACQRWPQHTAQLQAIYADYIALRYTATGHDHSMLQRLRRNIRSYKA